MRSGDASTTETVEDVDSVASYPFGMTAERATSGLVTALDASWTAKQPESSDFQRLRASFRVSDYGDTTVSLPSWFETVRERAPSVSGRVADDGTAIELTHEGGNPVVAGNSACCTTPTPVGPSAGAPGSRNHSSKARPRTSTIATACNSASPGVPRRTP